MLQENICLTLLPKNAHGITQRPTLKSKDKDSTVNKTEYRNKRNPTGKPRRARQTAKASGPYHLINR